MYDRQVKSAKRIWRNCSIFLLLAFVAGCASLFSQQPAEKPVQQRTIIGISAESRTDMEEIVIRATDHLDYSSVKQKTPPGILLYFPDTQLGDIPKAFTPQSDLIDSVKATATENNQNVRIEIDLNQDITYEVEKSDSVLRVFLKKLTATPTAGIKSGSKESAAPSGTVSGAAYRSEVAAVKNAAHPSQILPKLPTGKPSVISQIDFSSQESGASSIIIGTAQPVNYELKKTADRRLQLRLFDARLPQYREHRPLITTRFDSAVDRVTPIQALSDASVVDVIIELREQVPYRAERKDQQLILHFDPSSIGPRPLSVANLPSWQQVLEESAMESREPLSMGGEEKGRIDKSAYAQYFGGEKEYNGQKIALDFHETNIKNVFRIMQQISGKNYAIDPNVNGTVTISMEKPVPWDQVLDLILQQNKLGMENKGDIIRIATLQTMQQEEQVRQQRIQDFQKGQEQQKALEPLVTEYMPINYANAQQEILPHVQDILTENRGKISIDQRNNQVIITDVRDKITMAREIIARIDKVTPQVIIEARIVEVSEDFSREIGTDWAVASEDVFRDDLDGFYGYNVAMNHPAASASSIGFDFIRLPNMGTPLVLNARLTAMEQRGEGKIISSPKIVTVDNKKAMISQGFEYPYQTVEDNEVNVEFKDIDLTLEVTPHVTPDRRISLQIYVTKNDIDRITSTGEPALSTNEARTELLVDDGSTIVIGGIMKQTINVSEYGFPILKDIPLVGWLFKSQSNTNEKQELLIFMTPRIVQLEQRGLASN